jgi:murein DD-endopeptidase MepM/ murein hydrolase activator NlpD
MKLERLIFTLAILTGSAATEGVTSAQAPPEPADIGAPATAESGDTSALLDQLDKGAAEKARLEKEVVALNTNRSQTREALRSQTRALYRVVRAGMLPLSGGVNSLITRMARVARLKHSVRSDIQRLRELQEQSAHLERRDAELSNALEQARNRLGELQKRALPLPGEPGAAPISSADASASDSRFRGPNEERSFYGLRVVGAKPESAFARERGNLALPVSGEFSVRDAQREESDGPGLEFVTRAGTTVRAVAAGRVAFSDFYGSYGRLVIIEHGDNYYTVYGGLGNVEVRVGDDLSRSARVGKVAAGRTESALFFEVRRGARALSPRSWLGL